MEKSSIITKENTALKKKKIIKQYCSINKSQNGYFDFQKYQNIIF